jgi:hypothetical protein
MKTVVNGTILSLAFVIFGGNAFASSRCNQCIRYVEDCWRTQRDMERAAHEGKGSFASSGAMINTCQKMEETCYEICRSSMLSESIQASTPDNSPTRNTLCLGLVNAQ